MKQFIVTEDDFTELCILWEKATIVIELAIEQVEGPRVQVLAYIANDYLLELNKSLQALQMQS